MDEQTLHGPMKVVALVVLLLMAVAMVYAAYISVAHWTGIGV